MREQILAALGRGDEAEALGVVEPLDGASCHYQLPLRKVATNPGATKPGMGNQDGELTATDDATLEATIEARQIRCLKRILRRKS
jgi:hypothetical protein